MKLVSHTFRKQICVDYQLSHEYVTPQFNKHDSTIRQCSLHESMNQQELQSFRCRSLIYLQSEKVKRSFIQSALKFSNVD